MSQPDSPPTPVHQLALSIPRSDTHLRLHLTVYARALVLIFVAGSSNNTPADDNDSSTTTTILDQAAASASASSTSAGPAALGSFVYALPDATHDSKAVYATPLYSAPASHDTATRLARMLAARAKRPCYVGCGGGLRFWSVEDESAAVRAVLDAVLARLP